MGLKDALFTHMAGTCYKRCCYLILLIEKEITFYKCTFSLISALFYLQLRKSIYLCLPT